MKYYTLMLCAGFILESCTKNIFENITTTAISVVADTTDYHLIYPEADPILALYDFKDNINTEAYFRLSCIGDKSVGQVIELHLENGIHTEERNKRNTPHFRENHILAFYTKVRSSLEEYQHIDTSTTLDYSECYRTIVNEITYLMTKENADKRLIIFSDLIENSDIYNFYIPDNFPLPIDSSVDIAAHFENVYPLPDRLDGLKVYLVFQPKSRIEDAAYRAISDMYKYILEKRGAEVIIQSNNDNYE